MIGQAARAVFIGWVILRHGLPWTVYRDVKRRHLSNPDCGCAQDERMERRARRLRGALQR
jgi:hypothetical protein